MKGTWQSWSPKGKACWTWPELGEHHSYKAVSSFNFLLPLPIDHTSPEAREQDTCWYCLRDWPASQGTGKAWKSSETLVGLEEDTIISFLWGVHQSSFLLRILEATMPVKLSLPKSLSVLTLSSNQDSSKWFSQKDLGSCMLCSEDRKGWDWAGRAAGTVHTSSDQAS